MKNKTMFKTVIIVLLAAAGTTASARSGSTNRVTIGVMRFGNNIQADFNYGVPTTGTAPQTTPDGAAYNYDDGYVLTDSSGNAGNQTTYWGYDSAAQVDGNQILMSTTTLDGSSGYRGMDGSTPFAGFDVTYSRTLVFKDELQCGLDFSLGVMPMSFENNTRFASTATTTTDAYGFTSGTTPPSAPYQGTYAGPGFLLDASPVTGGSTTAPGPLVTAYSELDATLWALRIGPFVEFPVSEDLSLGLAGGASVGWLNVDATWDLTGAETDQGSDSHSETLPGAYLGGRLLWRMDESWRLRIGVEYEYLKKWEGRFGPHAAQIDFSQSIYVTLGLQNEF